MKDDLISKLAKEITNTKDVAMWDSISQLLLAVVSLNDKPDMQYIPNIIKILRLICVSKTPLKVLRYYYYQQYNINTTTTTTTTIIIIILILILSILLLDNVHLY